MLVQIKWGPVLDAVSALANSGMREFYAAVFLYSFISRYEKPSVQDQLKILRSSTQAAHHFQQLRKAIMADGLTAWSSSWHKGWAAVTQSISSAIYAVFTVQDAPSTSEHEKMLSIWRFERTQAALCLRAREKLDQDVLGQLRRRLPDMIATLTSQNWYNQQAQLELMTCHDVQRAADAIVNAFQEMLAEETVAAIDSLLQSPLDSPLQESAIYVQQRDRLEARIAKVSASYSFIEQLIL